LYGLGQSAQESNLARRVAAGPGTDMANVAASVLRQAVEGWHPNVGCDFPHGNVKRMLPEPFEYPMAVVVVDGGEVQSRPALKHRMALMPEICGIAFDKLAESMAHSFQEVIAGRETVGTN
jgi:hypothetical protein